LKILEEEGFVGRSAEETIKNMSRIGEIGMSLVDETMLGIMGDKKSRLRRVRNSGLPVKDEVSPPAFS
jgi:hypothetical protein